MTGLVPSVTDAAANPDPNVAPKLAAVSVVVGFQYTGRADLAMVKVV